MLAARPVLLAAAALGLTGCADLVGVSDPVAEFEISPLISGRYLLTMDAEDSLGAGEVWRFEVLLGIDNATARTMVMSWTALDRSSNGLVGSEQVYFFELDNDRNYDFLLEDFVLVVDQQATASGSQARIDGSLDGRFPILPPVEVASTAAFCGVVDGAFTEPTKGSLSGVTFAALFAEADGPLPTGKVSCPDLGE